MRRLAISVAFVVLCLATVSAASHAAQAPQQQPQIFIAARPAAVATSHARALQSNLEADTGSSWRLLWDPLTGSAVRGQGGRGQTSLQASQEQIRDKSQHFLHTHAQLLGVGRVPATADYLHHSGRSWHAVWRQRIDGREVHGAYLNVTLGEDGDVVAFRSSWVPETPRRWTDVDSEAGRRACEIFLSQQLTIQENQPLWAVVPESTVYSLVPARELTLSNAFGGRWRAVVAANGVLNLESLLRHERLQGTCTADVKPLYAEDPEVELGLPWLLVRLDDGRGSTTLSDAAANWSITLPPGQLPVSAGLEGLYALVQNAAGDPPALFEATATVPGVLPIYFGSLQARSDERTLYYHTNVIHDWVSSAFGFTLMDFPLPVTAAVRNPSNGSPDYANAFWDGTGMSFGNGGGRFPNFGLFADVIYHEYAHGITDFMYRPGGGLIGLIGGAIHEGLSDYFACTITDEPLVGEQLAALGGAFRNLDNNLLWPENRDPQDETHRNGEILAGALWDVRMLVGREIADPIIHFARNLHPQDFEEYMEAILTQDDLLFGDGAAANGTPHDAEILAAFAKHGMGPLRLQQLAILHDQLGDIETANAERTVRARLNTLVPGVIDAMYLNWSNGSENVRMPMQINGGSEWEAAIPGQPEGTQVNYWLETVKSRPHVQTTLPEGAPVHTFEYHVGPDTEPPLIEHAAPAELPAFAWPTTLGMTIQDNLGIANAWLEYRRNGGPRIAVGLVPDTSDPKQYRTSFPNVGGIIGDTFEYWIIAQDASIAGHVARLPDVGTFLFTLVENLEDGFELERGVWLHRPAVPGRDDPWHVSMQRNHTAGGSRSWYCGEEAGGYPVSTAAELATDWYLLGDGAHASVWSWMDAEPNGPSSAFDGGIVQILVEGEQSPTLLTPTAGYPRTMGDTADTNILGPGTPCLSGTDSAWQRLEFDLQTWAGERVQIQFIFGSDNVASTHSGWALDDFQLSPGIRNPTDTSVELPAAHRSVLQQPPAPNPFNPNVTFQLRTTPATGVISLDIIDVRGRLVRRLLAGALASGEYQYRWDGRDERGKAAASGVYWYRLRSSMGMETGQLVLVR